MTSKFKLHMERKTNLIQTCLCLCCRVCVCAGMFVSDSSLFIQRATATMCNAKSLRSDPRYLRRLPRTDPLWKSANQKDSPHSHWMFAPLDVHPRGLLTPSTSPQRSSTSPQLPLSFASTPDFPLSFPATPDCLLGGVPLIFQQPVADRTIYNT